MFKRRPPCPGDPNDYIWVKSKERPHWRRKRGRLKEASLNGSYQASNDQTKIVSPAASRVRKAVEPYLKGIHAGRLNNRISSAFRKSLKKRGELSFHYLKGIEMQREHPMDEMVRCDYRVSANEKTIVVTIPVESESVRAMNKLVTDYYFEAVVLYGDAGKERGLETMSTESKLYSYYGGQEEVCVLTLPLPEEDWCLLLKVSSVEGRELAVHTKHYRMKVIGASGEK